MDTTSAMVIRLRESTRGPVGLATFAWSAIVGVALFADRANVARSLFELLAVTATFLYAAYLGWNRRMGVVFFAPLVSWMFGWFPLIIGEMVRDGIVKGFFWGILLATFGWILFGFLEFVALFTVALPFRIATSYFHHDATFTIKGPFPFN